MQELRIDGKISHCACGRTEMSQVSHDVGFGLRRKSKGIGIDITIYKDKMK